MPLPTMLRRIAHFPYLALGLAAVVAYFVLGEASGAAPALYLGIGVAACAALGFGLVVHRPRPLRAWIALAGSQALWVGGDVVWFATGSNAVASVEDPLYLAGYAALAYALLALARSVTRRPEPGDVIDAATVALAGAVLAWPWVFHPHISEGEALEALLAIAYPALDLFLLALLARLFFQPGVRSRALLLVAASVVLVLVSDLAYAAPALAGSYDPGSWRDAGWLAGYVLIGAAGLHPSLRAPAVRVAAPTVVPISRLTAVAASMFALPTAGLVDFWRADFDAHDAVVFLSAAFAMVGLVVVRVGLLLAQIERLRREAEASERKLRTIFDSAGVGITIGADGLMTETNEAYQRMLGYTAEELASMHYLDVTHPDDRELTLPTEGLPPGESRALEKRYVRKDNSTLWAKVTLTNAKGGGFGIGIVEDVTARRQLEEELRQAQKMEAVGRLAGGIAHDFNNLLMAISGYAELALGRLRPGEKARRDVEAIAQSASRASELTHQLLAYSRRQVLRTETVDLNHAVSSAASLLRRLLGADVRLVTDLAPELPPVRADPAQLEQVVVNLAVNARDAMPEGGRLTVTTRAVELAAADAAARELETGPYVVLEVADTGHGMDERTLASAFEPFFSTKPPGQGSGLGLSMVYGAVKQSGGAAEIESAPGAGTLVRIFLPQAADGDEAPAPEPRAKPAEPASARARVLLVEDEAAVAALVREVLEEAGHEVVHAEDGRRGLELAASGGPFDLLVTDLVMPHASGRRVAEELLARAPGTPVLSISGYPGEEVVARGLLDAGTPLLEKPFALAALRERVEELLAARVPA